MEFGIMLTIGWIFMSVCAWIARFGDGAGAIMRRRLLLGWLLYGLMLPVPAFIHAMFRRPTIEERRTAVALAGMIDCPHCLAPIYPAAKACPHCARALRPVDLYAD